MKERKNERMNERKKERKERKKEKNERNQCLLCFSQDLVLKIILVTSVLDGSPAVRAVHSLFSHLLVNNYGGSQLVRLTDS